jgi:hypothetical protein
VLKLCRLLTLIKCHFIIRIQTFIILNYLSLMLVASGVSQMYSKQFDKPFAFLDTSIPVAHCSGRLLLLLSTVKPRDLCPDVI